jgi:hypothetical protein
MADKQRVVREELVQQGAKGLAGSVLNLVLEEEIANIDIGYRLR